MLYKLSFRNAKRQVRDYTVYLVTVMLAVTLMFAFNSLGDSAEIKALSETMRQLPVFIIFTSVVVVGIMGWLIYYIMKFMLEKRSHEFGTYLLMGLEKKQIVRMFFVENILLGIVAFLLGIFLGNVVFQGLKAILLSLYDAEFIFMFSFSKKALGYTLIYLIFMYFLALLRSGRTIGKTKIYTLLYSNRKNEEAKLKSSNWKQTGFIISLIMAAIGMMFLMRVTIGTSFTGAVLLIIALYVFFINFSAGVPAFFDKRPTEKYKGTNLLVFRQLSSKLKTMGIVMATVSVLFTITLIAEGAGLQFINQFQRNEELRTRFDFYVSNTEMGSGLEEYKRYIHENDVAVKQEHEYQIYCADNNNLQQYLKQENPKYWYDYEQDTLMKMSDYIILREMLGYEAVEVQAGEYILHGLDVMGVDLHSYDGDFELKGTTLKRGGIYTENLTQYLWGGNGDGFIFVVPDELTKNQKVANYAYAVTTEKPIGSAVYNQLVSIRDRKADVETDRDIVYYIEGIYDTIYSVSSIKEENTMLYALIIFPLFYLSLIFIMTATTILTVQLLSETNRYKDMFVLLNKLGQSRKDAKKVLNRILGSYYLMPVIPALVISISFLIALSKVFDYGIVINASHLALMVGSAVGIFAVIYLLYIMVAYVSFRRNVYDKR